MHLVRPAKNTAESDQAGRSDLRSVPVNKQFHTSDETGMTRGKFHCPESFPSGKLADEKIVAED
jgi:hypothetical protein